MIHSQIEQLINSVSSEYTVEKNQLKSNQLDTSSTDYEITLTHHTKPVIIYVFNGDRHGLTIQCPTESLIDSKESELLTDDKLLESHFIYTTKSSLITDLTYLLILSDHRYPHHYSESIIRAYSEDKVMDITTDTGSTMNVTRNLGNKHTFFDCSSPNFSFILESDDSLLTIQFDSNVKPYLSTSQEKPVIIEIYPKFVAFYGHNSSLSELEHLLYHPNMLQVAINSIQKYSHDTSFSIIESNLSVKQKQHFTSSLI